MHTYSKAVATKLPKCICLVIVVVSRYNPIKIYYENGIVLLQTYYSHVPYVYYDLLFLDTARAIISLKLKSCRGKKNLHRAMHTGK